MAQFDINKLSSIITEEAKTDDEHMLYRDTFAVICYLNRIGQKRAASKLLRTLANHLGRNRRQTFFADLSAKLTGNEIAFAKSIQAHCEINELIASLEPRADD